MAMPRSAQHTRGGQTGLPWIHEAGQWLHVRKGARESCGRASPCDDHLSPALGEALRDDALDELREVALDVGLAELAGKLGSDVAVHDIALGVLERIVEATAGER